VLILNRELSVPEKFVQEPTDGSLGNNPMRAPSDPEKVQASNYEHLSDD